MVNRSSISIFVIFILTSGCVGWTNAPRVATTCSPEDTWSVALASLQEFELRRIDKASGVIETGWIAVHNPKTVSGGVFQRDMNQERARFILNITPDQSGSQISVKQIREFFSPQGVQSRSWRQIPGHEEQERQLATRIQNRLKRQAC
ncbi:MAG: hypothetical protein JSU60_01625 [Nitrospirota bacterium]|nr:MAG: hypothetical protein JSU60_01625 [Nitrospirota bacterium]